MQIARRHQIIASFFLGYDPIKLNRIMTSSLLFEHDLRATASRLSRGKTGSQFSML